MKKIRFLGLCLALCLALGLSACGGGEEEEAIPELDFEGTSDSSENQAPVDWTQPTEETPAETPAGTEAPAEAPAETETPAQAPAEPAAPAGTETPAPAEAAGTASAADGESLVAFFATTDELRGLAETLTVLTDSSLYEIDPALPYSDADLDFANAESRGAKEAADPAARPEIAGEPLTLAGYARVYLGYPVWQGQAPRILSTFVESQSFDGVTVIPFTVDGEIGQTAEQLAQLAGGGNWLPGQSFSAAASEADLQTWINGIQ